MRYAAFLRGINIRTRQVKMDQLKRHFEDLNVSGVSTFIASGNVIFEAEGASATLERRIEAHLRERLGFEVNTFVRSETEVQSIAEHEPFAEPGTVYIALLRKAPDAETRTKLLALASKQDLLAVHDREVYWLSRGGFGQSPVGGGLGKLLGAQHTLRNANTLRRLAKKFAQDDTQPARRSRKVSASPSAATP
jgi:uncharacterized protein (DUF1697 family)